MLLFCFCFSHAEDDSEITIKNTLTWNFDDEALSSLYFFPKGGMGLLLSIPALATDPSEGRWKRHGEDSDWLSGKKPKKKLFSSVRWSAALPLNSQMTLRAQSGSRAHFRYAETLREEEEDLTSQRYSYLDFLYQSHIFTLAVRESFWSAELNATRHQFGLQALGTFEENEVNKEYREFDYSGSAWNAGLRLGIWWVQIGLDFATHIPLSGQSDEQENPEFSIPRRLQVVLEPTRHFRCEYIWRKDAFHLNAPVIGELSAKHQFLVSSSWKYAYLYGGALLLDSDSDWKIAKDALPRKSIMPQAGAGLTFGHSYKFLTGAEIFPAVRILLGAEYAL